MSKRALVNLGLLVLVGVLAALVYMQPGIEGEPPKETLTDLSPARIERVGITREDGERVVFSRGASGWEIVEPIRARANEFRIKPLLELARAESHSRFGAVEAELAQYHLDRPLAVLRLNGVVLRFGETEPIDHRRYVMVGDTVHLIEDRYYYRVRSPLPNFVSPRLLPRGAEPTAIRFPGFEVARDGEGRWRLTPAGPEVSMDAVNAFLARWRDAQAADVTRYHPDGQEGGDRIRVELQGGAGPLEFLILDRGPEPVLARPDIGMRYHLAGEQGERLLERPADDAGSEERGVRSEE